MNQISMIGRFVRDIELKMTNNNKQVVNNSLAINRLFKQNSDQQADFIPVTFWGKTAELVDKYCEKGHLVGVTGRIQSRNYQNSNNETVYVVEVIADEVQFLQARDNSTDSSNEEKLIAQQVIESLS